MQKRSLSAEKIVALAIETADRTGIDALSMRGLATSLQVTPMSLYNHIANKDALLDLMLDRVIAKVALPADPHTRGDWEAFMRQRAHSMRATLLRHRWALPMIISRIALGDAVKRDSNETLKCLVEGGFTYPQADWARNAIDSHIYGYVLQELNFPVKADEYQATAARYLPMIEREKYPYSYEAAAAVAKGHYDGIISFDFGLDLIINGLGRWVAD